MARCAAAGLLVLALARPARSATMLRGLAPLMDYKPGDVLFGEYNLTSFMGVQLSRHHSFSEQELGYLLAVAEHPAEPPASALQLADLLQREGPPPELRRQNAGLIAANLVKTNNMVLGQEKKLYRPPTPSGFDVPGTGTTGFLGSGNFGDVWRANKWTGHEWQPVVLKFMVDPQTRLHSTGREAHAVQKKEYHNDCQVPQMIEAAANREARLRPYAVHFAKCFGSTAGYEADQNEPVYVALEDAGTGCKDLNGWVPANRENKKKVNRKKMEGLAKQLFRALALIHHLGVVHQDTKPENIMIRATGRLWLVDFGRANRLKETEDQTYFGDPGWMGPEMARQPQQTSYGVDMWSAGLTVLFMFTGANFKDFQLQPQRLAGGGWKQILPGMCQNGLCKQTALFDSKFITAPNNGVLDGVFRELPMERRPAMKVLNDWGYKNDLVCTVAEKTAPGQPMQQMVQAAPVLQPQQMVQAAPVLQPQQMAQAAPMFNAVAQGAAQHWQQFAGVWGRRGLLQQRQEEEQAPPGRKGRLLRAPILAGGQSR